MKLFVIFQCCMLMSLAAFSQSFTFNRVSTDMGDVKMRGEISIVGDTTIIITSFTPVEAVSPFKVVLSSDAGIQKQYFTVFPEGATTRLRLTLTNPHPMQKGMKKGETGVLNYEYFDDFNNTSTTMLYYLIPRD